MLNRDLPLFSSLLMCFRSCLIVLIGTRGKDDWEPIYANDPRFQDEEYEFVLATTRSVN